MVYGCGCLVMVGITLFLIWAAVVLSNPTSAALLLGTAVFATLWRHHQEKKEKMK